MFDLPYGPEYTTPVGNVLDLFQFHGQLLRLVASDRRQLTCLLRTAREYLQKGQRFERLQAVGVKYLMVSLQPDVSLSSDLTVHARQATAAKSRLGPVRKTTTPLVIIPVELPQVVSSDVDDSSTQQFTLGTILYSLITTINATSLRAATGIASRDQKSRYFVARQVAAADLAHFMVGGHATTEAQGVDNHPLSCQCAPSHVDSAASHDIDYPVFLLEIDGKKIVSVARSTVSLFQLAAIMSAKGKIYTALSKWQHALGQALLEFGINPCVFVLCIATVCRVVFVFVCH
jgi:hypothetical protein